MNRGNMAAPGADKPPKRKAQRRRRAIIARGMLQDSSRRGLSAPLLQRDDDVTPREA